MSDTFLHASRSAEHSVAEIPDPAPERRAWEAVAREMMTFPAAVRDLPVAPEASAATASAHRTWLTERYTFDAPMTLEEITADVMRRLRDGTIHVTSPRYFGLFNPSVRTAGVVADALTALYNPQLAAWSHAPAACEIERHTLRRLAALLGLQPDSTHATFTTGGAESNLSALLAALAHQFPAYATTGIAGLGVRPAIYLSAEGHHSFVKAARMAGLGTDSLRTVPTTDRLTLDPVALAACIEADWRAGWYPLMVIATAGSTGAGVVDPIGPSADVAAACGAWFHVDAAWGGMVAFVPRLRPLLAGLERADSVTWDAHKGLSVPMGAGMFFCRHPDAVARAFAITASYMPPAGGADAIDPYATTAQWSRRAIGLKLFMSLAELGVEGYGALIDRQTRLADHLRDELTRAGWLVVNETPLPVVCFTHHDIRTGRLATADVLRAVYERRRVWISDVVLGEGSPAGGERVLRACVTSMWSDTTDVACLVSELETARGSAMHVR